VYAVKAGGEILRVEILYGVIAAADPRVGHELGATYFPTATPSPGSPR
jgi:hypothetical protein